MGDLLSDHRRLRRLLARLSRAQDAGVRELLFQDIQDELHVHARIEEEGLYEVVRQAAHRPSDRRLYFEALEEHAAIERLLDAMRHAETGSETFAAQSTLLRDQVGRHAEGEERRLFPIVRRCLGHDGVSALGRQMRRHRARLMGHAAADDLPAGWRPFLPRHPD